MQRPTRFRRVARLLLLALLAVGAVVVARTLLFESKQIAVAAAPEERVDAAAFANRLAGALRIATVSTQEPADVDALRFVEFRDYLARTYPLVHARLTRELVNGDALLFTWAGAEASLAPMLLLAHQDVVPIEKGTEKDWTHPPFAGDVADGFVWGRGSLDDKASLLASLEAAEGLLAEGFAPRRTILFAFGHDEEVGGRRGAMAIAKLLSDRKIHCEFGLDEGLPISVGIVPGVTAPVALIGLGEKGYLSVELVARSEGGHSSTPSVPSAIGRLSRAIRRLEQTQLPARLEGPFALFADWVGPEMPFAPRMAFANRWLFGPLLERQLSSGGATNALLRTTTAPTIFQGGVKDNVLPQQARAVVNFRVLPGDSSEDVLAHVRRIIEDPAIEVTPFGEMRSEPSPMSQVDAPGFELIRRSVRETFTDVVVAPSVLIGASDARHYSAVVDNLYRFFPARIARDDVKRVHGTNERLGVENAGDYVRFYRRLMRHASGPP